MNVISVIFPTTTIKTFWSILSLINAYGGKENFYVGANTVRKSDAIIFCL